MLVRPVRFQSTALPIRERIVARTEAGHAAALAYDQAHPRPQMGHPALADVGS
jgi:hypothetical protein